MFPTSYTADEKSSQRTRGAAMLKELNDLLTSRSIYIGPGATAPTSYTIAPGVYRIAGAPAVHAWGVKGFTLIAKDVEIISESDSTAIQLDDCSDWTIEGPVVFDYDPVSTSQGTIVASNPVQKTIDVKVADGYPLDVIASPIYAYDTAGTWIGHSFNHMTAISVVDAPSRTLRLAVDWADAPFSVGNLISFGYWGKAGTSMSFGMGGVKNLTLTDVAIYGGGMSWFGDGTGAWKLTRVKATRRPGTNRLRGSANGSQQAVHLGGQSSVLLDSCEFGYSNDDLINYRGSNGVFMTFAQESARVAVLKGGSYAPGDTLEFYGFPSWQRHGKATVISAVDVNDPAIEAAAAKVVTDVVKARSGVLGGCKRVTFDADLNLAQADIVDNVSTRAGDLQVRNSYFHDSTVRVMFQGFNSGTFEGNVFQRVNIGLHLTTDAWWWEGSMWKDMVIRNNLFDQTNYDNWRGALDGAIMVRPGVDDKTATARDVYSSVDIECNVIPGSSGNGIVVGNVGNVTIRNNEIGPSKGPGIVVTSAGTALVENNRVVGGADGGIQTDHNCGNVLAKDNSFQ